MAAVDLVSQAGPTSARKGRVCVYKPCLAALYSAVQSCCSILSHDTLHHCLSSNSSLENSEREQGHLSRYCRNCKNTSRIVIREHAYSATGNSGAHYLKSGYVIQLIAFRWDTACIHSSPDPSLSCGSESGLRDYCGPSLRTGNVCHSLYKPLSLFTFDPCLVHEGPATTAPVMRLP